jgi:hypothetical protein
MLTQRLTGSKLAYLEGVAEFGSKKRRHKTLDQTKNPLDTSERVCELVGEIYAARTTLPAWKPFGPFSRSNSTVSPSFSER